MSHLLIAIIFLASILSGCEKSSLVSYEMQEPIFDLQSNKVVASESCSLEPEHLQESLNQVSWEQLKKGRRVLRQAYFFVESPQSKSRTIIQEDVDGEVDAEIFCVEKEDARQPEAEAPLAVVAPSLFEIEEGQLVHLIWREFSALSDGRAFNFATPRQQAVISSPENLEVAIENIGADYTIYESRRFTFIVVKKSLEDQNGILWLTYDRR